MSDLSAAIVLIVPDADYLVRDGRLIWNDARPEPSEAQIASALVEVGWGRIRVQRDRLLAACDWTQVADAPVDAAAWAVYRQALRDVPQDFDSPDDVVWPTPPV